MIYKLTDRDGTRIGLGIRGESGLRTLTFDVAPWITEYGAEGTLTAYVITPDRVQRSYQLAVDQDGIATWTVPDEIMQRRGNSALELSYQTGTVTAKGPIYGMVVGRDILS